MTIPVFIISLDDAAERRANLLAALKKFRVSFEIISAVDGRNGLPRIYEKKIDRANSKKQHGRELTSGEYACGLSHQKIYGKIVSEKIKVAIILEDDAIISREFVKFSKQHHPKWADILMFNHDRSRVWMFPWRTVIGEAKAFRHARKSPILTSGYYLNRRAAKYILENSQPLCRPADWPCEIYGLRSFSVLPKIVTSEKNQTGAMTSYLNTERKLSTQNAFWKA